MRHEQSSVRQTWTMSKKPFRPFEDASRTDAPPRLKNLLRACTERSKRRSTSPEQLPQNAHLSQEALPTSWHFGSSARRSRGNPRARKPIGSTIPATRGNVASFPVLSANNYTVALPAPLDSWRHS